MSVPSTGEGLFTRMPLVRKPVNLDSHDSSGDLERDRDSGTFSFEWANFAAFEEWRTRVERDEILEWTLQHTDKSMGGGRYLLRKTYTCARGKVRGTKPYEKKHPTRKRKVPAKAAGCPAQLIIKTYPNTQTVLGYFDNAHSHPVGDDNARFCRISFETRLRIAEMLRTGVDPDRIVCLLSTELVPTNGIAVARSSERRGEP